MELLSYCVIIIGKVFPMHAMKSYVGTEVQLHSFLSKLLDGLSDQLQALADLPPRKDPVIPIGREAQFTAGCSCKKVNFTLQVLVQQKEEKDAF